MSWVTVAAMGGTALLGAIKEKEAKQAQAAQNMAAAEQTRMSPWTGMGAGQTDYTPHSQLMGAMGGAISGAGLASNIKKAGLFSAKPEVAPVTGLQSGVDQSYQQDPSYYNFLNSYQKMNT